MKKHYMIGLTLCIIFLQSCSKQEFMEIEEQNNLTISVSSNTQTDFENQLFDLINEYRVSIGLNELQFESTSYFYANEHNRFMIEKGQISHAHFGQRAKSISDKTGANDVSENVARHYDTATEAFEGWLNSPNHRKNLEGNYTHSALSVLTDDNGELYYTQIFIK